MSVKHIKGIIAIALTATILSAGFGQAKTDEDMVASIMELRADIEALYTEIDRNRENYKGQIKSLVLQIADSEAQINRKETSVKLANIDLQKIEEKIAATSNETVELGPLLQDAFIMQEKSIKEGFPFKVEERLAALDKTRTELEEKQITQERALALLWASYADNLRLTREIGLFRQNISIDGKNVMANVAKIGTVMLFFSTPDGQVGYATRDGARYRYHKVAEKKKKREIALLFDSLNKQIRTGYFTLPNALVVKGGEL